MMLIGPRCPPDGEMPWFGSSYARFHDESTVDHVATSTPCQETLVDWRKVYFEHGDLRLSAGIKVLE